MTGWVSNKKDLAHRRVGRVAVAALPSVAAEWMPQVIARYRAANPQIKVELFDLLAGPALSLLREGSVDMAITAGEDLREFDCRVLRLEKFFFHLPGRPSVGQGGVGHVIAGCRCRDDASVPQQHLQAQPAMLAAPPPGLEVEHLVTLAALIAQGLGTSVVPELTLFHFHRERLMAIPIRDRQLRRPIVLARHKARARRPVHPPLGGSSTPSAAAPARSRPARSARRRAARQKAENAYPRPRDRRLSRKTDGRCERD